jgi:dolichyl-phosphate-mannose--protein O-mannosyl transferase
MLVALIIVPPLVYVFSYAPSLDGAKFTPWVKGSWARNFAREQREMVNFHLFSKEIYYVGKTNRDVSPAWSWFLIKRPEHYYFHETGNEHGRIMGMGSPLVWWTSLAALVYLGLKLAKDRKNDASIVTLTAIAVLYLPFLLVSSVRAAPFLHDILPSVPFMCLALATVTNGWKKASSTWIVIGFTTAAVAMFVFFYPILSGLPVSQEALQAREWFQDCERANAVSTPGWCWK